MGFFDFLSSSSKRPQDMSDSELIRELKKIGSRSVAGQSALIKEAKKRGLDIPSL